MEIITGTIGRINYQQDGFLIARLTSGESVIGNCEDPQLWQEYEFRGDWDTHPKFGKQFKFNLYRAILPQDLDGIRRYIIRAKWVGIKVANQIVKTFAEESLQVLKNEPQKVAEAIKGITLQRAEELSASLKNQEEMEQTVIELESLIGDQHLPKHTIPDLITKHRSNAPALIRQDPYWTLMQVRGVGFPTADRVAILALGYDRESLPRRRAAVIHVLQEAADSRGHVWLTLTRLQEKVQELTGLPPGDALEKLLEEKAVVVEQTMVALADLSREEKLVAGRVQTLLDDQASLIESLSVDLKGLAPDQQEAFGLALQNPVFILTGAPGTGKTFTLRKIIEQFTAWNWKIALAAPTGKAAKRMSEVIDLPASTIHRLLGPVFNGEQFSFFYGKEEPLPFDLVVIDEFSMVDIRLASSLLQAIPKGARLLIVGDHYQLPSVGPGAVLRDLLAAGVPSFELTEIKRNSGDIVKACHAIKDDRPFLPSVRLEPETGLNLRHIQESDPLRIQSIIRDLVAHRLPQRGYDPVWDVQVLSPMNERTALSCLHLNELLQEALNINPPIKGTPYRLGDKVIQRKNEGIDGEFVVNGDLGEILEVTDHHIRVRFIDPERIVSVPRKDNHLALAYCLTIHKMQGSEAPVIILPVHSSFGGFFNRELLYTGISRAQDICLTVGEWGALEQAAGRIGNARRVTRLTELLKEKN